jgi:hypothetical protein
MKTQNHSAFLPIVIAALAAAPFAHAGPKVLIDFGNNSTFRGATSPSPDSNGKHWNSVNPGAFTADMVSTTGAATTIDLGFDPSGDPVGTDSYNGPAGETMAPIDQAQIDAVAINAAALGDLGIKEAAFDYVSSTGGRFQIQGLDPLKRYKITFYGSSKFTTDATTFYTVYDDSGFSNQLATANLDIRDSTSPWLHNQDEVAVLTDLIPSTGGVLYVEFGGTNGASGRLNSLSIEDSPVEITGPAVLVDFGNASSFRGVDVTSPDTDGNHWNSIAPGAYWSNMNDTTGAATTIDLGFSTAAGTDSYNGPAGATSDPVTPAEIAATNIDAASMGRLGIKEAAIDFVSGTDVVFEIAGLDPAKKFNLHFFGSRRFPADTTTVYTVYEDSLLTTEIGQASLLVGNGVNNNPGSVAVIRELTPSAGGALHVKFTGSSGGEGSLNALAIEEADTTPPVITINGNNPETVTWGDTYTDAGATATDNIDGSVSVSSSGSVDTSLLGSYQINYSATDAAGNNATAFRTVNVVLPANPTLPGDDGLSALEKYAYGATGPNAAVQVPASAKVGNDLVLTAVIRTNDPNLSVLGKTSIDLVNWSDLALNPAGVAAVDQTNLPANTQRREFTLPGGDPKRFLRLSITSP